MVGSVLCVCFVIVYVCFIAVCDLDWLVLCVTFWFVSVCRLIVVVGVFAGDCFCGCFVLLRVCFWVLSCWCLLVAFALVNSVVYFW